MPRRNAEMKPGTMLYWLAGQLVLTHHLHGTTNTNIIGILMMILNANGKPIFSSLG